MGWNKLGKIFQAKGQYDWLISHTACPIPLALGGGVFRVYVGARDIHNRPSIGYFTIHIEEPKRIHDISESPVLRAGPWGYFDDNGVYPGCIVKDGDKLLMYYLGRTNGEGPLYTMAIGLAQSSDGGVSFERVMPCPLLARSPYDPWMVSTPWVLREKPQVWKMWYLSGLGWSDIEKGISKYHIKYAESEDGRQWERRGVVAIDIEGDETNIASPSVWYESGEYRALYCVASLESGYRLAAAHSNDGKLWHKDGTPAGLELARQGWDSDCMAYPAVFTHNGQKYVLYSGNKNGLGGVGVAIETGGGD